MKGIKLDVNRGCAFVDGKLIDAVVKSTKVTRISDESIETSVVVAHNGDDYTIRPQDFYLDKKHFEISESVGFSPIYIEDMLGILYDEDMYYYWYFCDGKAEKVCFDFNVVEMFFDESGNITSVKTDRELPENVYKTEKEVYDFNYVEHIDENGNVTKEFGYALKLKLNDEQQKEMKKFVDSFKRLRKLGVDMWLDENENLIAINDKGIENRLAYDSSDVEDDGFDRVISTDKFCTGISLGTFYEHELYVKS